MSAKGSVYKRCGCRIQGTGKRFGNDCPELSRRGHGSWYYAVDIGPYPGSRRRRVRRGGFASRDAAEEALRQLQTPGPADAGAPLLTTGQWLRIWLAGRISLCPSTLRGYASHVNDYLQPHLGSIPLRALDTRHLQQMFIHILGGRTASGRPVTAATLKRIHATLRTALNAAMRERLIGDNPARYVERPPAPRPHAVVWTEDQIRHWRASARVSRRSRRSGRSRPPPTAAGTRSRAATGGSPAATARTTPHARRTAKGARCRSAHQAR
ncbi:hypothetical protein AB0L00_18765 [Actinoallomurus sp. NPDC052308]|uniref:hypothetical protein n=1 Tax=Actinoallomurus sp. NPDC052308 TaxID=3155530 RepID=UPI00341418D4